MKLERVDAHRLRLELHTMELTALVAAARWVADGAEGELPSAAVDQLRHVLAGYEAELARMRDATASS
jgi:predicted DNA-binding transcriptional regulator YafY